VLTFLILSFTKQPILSYLVAENDFNDRELLLRIAAGEKQAFALLYNRHAPWLTRYIRLFTGDTPDTEELLQDVFVKVWNKKEQLPEIEQFEAWLNRVTRNTVFNYLRALKLRHQLHELDEGASARAGSEQADDRLLLQQYYIIASRAIEKLPARRKQVFQLRLEQNLTLDEIANLLGISRSAVEQHVYAANSFIRDYLNKHAEIKTLLIIFMSLFDY
jgi:RNA polymerase sigma-70 factor (family 1)